MMIGMVRLGHWLQSGYNGSRRSHTSRSGSQIFLMVPTLRYEVTNPPSEAIDGHSEALGRHSKLFSSNEIDQTSPPGFRRDHRSNWKSTANVKDVGVISLN